MTVLQIVGPPAPSRLVANDDRVHAEEDREAGDRLPAFRQPTEEEGDGQAQQEHHRVVGDALSVQERARRDRYSRYYRRQERETAPEEQRQEVIANEISNVAPRAGPFGPSGAPWRLDDHARC